MDGEILWFEVTSAHGRSHNARLRSVCFKAYFQLLRVYGVWQSRNVSRSVAEI